MQTEEYQAWVASQMSESTLQAQVEQIARSLGWLTYHTRDSRRSAAGFPDLCMVRRGRLVFAELKTERGRVSRPQQEWIDSLREVEAAGREHGHTTDHIAMQLWRPRDVVSGAITEVLR